MVEQEIFNLKVVGSTPTGPNIPAFRNSLKGGMMNTQPDIHFTCLRIKQGTRLAWYAEDYAEDNHRGRLKIETGLVLINGEERGGNGFWVVTNFGERKLIQRQWLLDDAEILKLNGYL